MIKAWSKKLEQGRELQLASVCRESGTPYQGQASSNQGQASSDQGRASSNQGQQGQASSDPGQASSNQGQASSDKGEASTNQGQTSTSQGPASKSQGQASSSNGQDRKSDDKVIMSEETSKKWKTAPPGQQLDSKKTQSNKKAAPLIPGKDFVGTERGPSPTPRDSIAPKPHQAQTAVKEQAKEETKGEVNDQTRSTGASPASVAPVPPSRPARQKTAGCIFNNFQPWWLWGIKTLG